MEKIQDAIHKKAIIIYFNINCNPDHYIEDKLYVSLIPHNNSINGKCIKK